MDYFYTTLLLLFVSYIAFFFFFLFNKEKPTGTGTPSLPPGRTGLPFFGESFEFLSASWKGHPETFIRDRVTKYSSQLIRTSLLGEKVVMFCSAEGNKFLFSNDRKLVTNWWPDSVNKVFPFTAESSIKEASLSMRKMFPHFMKPETLRNYIGMMDTIAQNHFETEWRGRKEVVVFPTTKNFTFLLACKLFVSLDDPVRLKKLLEPFELIAAAIIALPLDLPGTQFRRGINASNFVRKELGKIIKQRKADINSGLDDKKDILSHMLTACDEDGQYMDELDIADKILGLLVGGHDTGSVVCTFIVKYLAELPHVYDQVYQEQMEVAKTKAEGELLNWDDLQKMKYSWNVICEAMRLAPPVQGGFKEAISDFVFNGYFIPKGWKLFWSTNSTHKNPKFFPEPEKFDPDRFKGTGPAPYTYVPFGGGPRMCPGKEYARLEVLVYMHNLVKRFKFEKIIADEKITINPIPILEKGLPVRVYPHSST